MQIEAIAVTVGTRLASDNGEALTVTKIEAGDKTPFGRIGKFWHPEPLTFTIRLDDGDSTKVCVAPSDVFGLYAKQEG